MKRNKMKSLAIIFYLWMAATHLQAQIPEGARAAATNINAGNCPCLFADNRVMFTVNAPGAGKVQVDLGRLYDLQKNDQGVWIVITDPQVPGFHYYSLVIDGFKFADPASESFYGTGRMASAIDIPEPGVDFYDLKDVLHGDLRSKNYFSKTTGTWRSINIYTPPGYDQDKSKTYPIMYIQHGGGEDERGWAVQGKANLILDNLLAEGKAVPMIVVMPDGNVMKPGMTAGGYTDEAMTAFKEELFNDVMPFIQKHFRVRMGAANTALAGLSMGGGQSFYTGLRNTEKIGNVGIFSTGLFGGITRPNSPETTFDAEAVIPGLLSNPSGFNKRLNLFYISVGEQDPRIEPTKKLVETFKNKGLKVSFASFPGGHEWQVWRKSLHDFAQMLFK